MLTNGRLLPGRITLIPYRVCVTFFHWTLLSLEQPLSCILFGTPPLVDLAIGLVITKPNQNN